MEFVFRLALAGLRRVRAMRFQDRHGVAGYRVFAPNVNMMTFAQTHLKITVSFDRPDRAE